MELFMIYYEIQALLNEWINLSNDSKSRLDNCIPLSFMDYIKLRSTEYNIKFIDDIEEWYRIRAYRKKKDKIDEKKGEIEDIFKQEQTKTLDVGGSEHK